MRERESVCVCVRERERVCVCERERERERERVCVCVRERERERERERQRERDRDRETEAEVMGKLNKCFEPLTPSSLRYIRLHHSIPFPRHCKAQVIILCLVVLSGFVTLSLFLRIL